MDFFTQQLQQIDAVVRYLEAQEPVAFLWVAEALHRFAHSVEPFRLEMDSLVEREGPLGEPLWVAGDALHLLVFQFA